MRKVLGNSASWAVVVWLALAAPAVACPFCNGGADGVNEVQQEIFTRHFWPNVLRVAAPFPIFAAIAVALHFGFGPERPAVEARTSPGNRTETPHD